MVFLIVGRTNKLPLATMSKFTEKASCRCAKCDLYDKVQIVKFAGRNQYKISNLSDCSALGCYILYH